MRDFNIKKHPRCFFLGLSLLVILGVLFFVFFPFIWNPSSPLVSFIDTFYTMTPNQCWYGRIKGINLLGYAYGSIIVFSFSWAFLESRKRVAFKSSLYRVFPVATWAMILLITFFQLKFQVRQFAYEYKYFQGPDPAGKYKEIYKDTFGFAQYCRVHVVDKSRAVIKSDLDLNRGEGFFLKTELAYFLYPINILGRDDPSPDIIIVYKRKNPQSVIPAGFTALPPYDQDSLIAVRKETP